MQVRIEDVSPVEKKLIVEVPWSTVDKKLSAAYRELSRTVQLRGFRKGKVPRSVLQRMYGKHVRAEVTSQLVHESLITAATEHDVQAISEPRVDSAPDIEAGKPLSFEAIVEVKGDVVARDYDGLALTRPPNEVSEEEIAAQLDALRLQHAELLPIEGRNTTARTDVLTVDLTGTVGEHEVEQPGMTIDLTRPEEDPVPGLIAALTGLPTDVEDHPVELVIPEDFRDPDLAGKTARFTITVTDARKKELPELDDEFAKDLDRGETLADLRESIRADLQKRHDEENKRVLRRAAIKAVIERNEIPVASSLVERGVDLQFQRLKAMFGLPEGQSGGLELDDKMRETMRPAALEEVRGELLLEAIAKQENIEVTEDMLDEHISEMATRSGTPRAKLRAELDRDDQLGSIRFHIRRDKTLDLLIERATVTIAEPAEEPPSDASGDASGDPSGDPSMASGGASSDETAVTPAPAAQDAAAAPASGESAGTADEAGSSTAPGSSIDGSATPKTNQ